MVAVRISELISVKPLAPCVVYLKQWIYIKLLISLITLHSFSLSAILRIKAHVGLSNFPYKVLAKFRGLKWDLESNKEATISSPWKAVRSAEDEVPICGTHVLQNISRATSTHFPGTAALPLWPLVVKKVHISLLNTTKKKKLLNLRYS